MADYENLLDSIDAVIKSNNRREITGQILQNTLHQMVGSLGENYQLAGFATPTLDPNSPDQNVFYITDEAGVYTNFDNITLGAGLSFLMWKNEEWTSKTLDVVTADWLDEHYVSKAFLRKVFQFFDEDGVEIFPNDTESVVDNIKAMCGLWTNEYLSALGLGEGSTIPTTLAALNDVTITNPQDGQALVYDAASLHWVNATIQSGVDMSVVWAALAGATNEQINISHLSTALSDYVTATNLATTLQSYVTTSALATELANYASQNWVETNYVSKAFFNSLFEAQDVNGNAITPNNSGQTTIDRLKILVGAYTEQYLSALGLSSSGGGGGSSTLAGLNDVTITNPQDGQALIYDAQSNHWVNGAAISMSAVWTALAAATSEQINSSHLTSALSGYVTTSALASELANYVTTSGLATTLADYVTTSALATTLADYGSKTWIDNNYVSKTFFNRLFQAFAPLAEGQTEPTQVEPNDTTTTIDNIKAMFGLWTEQYLSALGLGSDAGHTIGVLNDLNDVTITNPQTNQVLRYNGTQWVNETAPSGASALSGLTDVAISSLADKDLLQWDYATGKWKNVVLSTIMSGYATTSQLANYLPLSGGTLYSATTATPLYLKSSTQNSYIGFIKSDGTNIGYLGIRGDRNNAPYYATGSTEYEIWHKGNLTDNNQLTNGAGYITGITSSMVTTALGYTPANSSLLSNYLPLSGGTMTGIPKASYILFKNYNDDGSAGYCGRGSTDVNEIQLVSYTGNKVKIYTNNSVLALTADSQGRVGIKMDSPSYDLDVSGTFHVSNNTEFGAPITFSGIATQNVGIINAVFNSTTYDIIWQHGNGNVSIDSCGGGLYLGYFNTTNIYARGNYINLDSGNWSSYIGTSSAYVGYANYATSAGKLSTARNIYGQSFDGSADITGPAVIRDGGYASGNSPSLGALNNKTIAFLSGYGNSGQPYGLYYWCEATSGRVCLQCGRQDGDTAAYPICLQPLGGKVGIGTQTPTQLLEVNGVAECIYMFFNSTSGSTPSGYVGRGGSTNDLQLQAYSGNKLNLGANNGSGDIFIDLTHYVGIGNKSPSYRLHVSGDIYATGGVTSLSDIRKKDVVSRELPLNIEQIANAPTIKFTWKDKREEGEQVGTIAQYWQDVLPWVIKDKSDELSMQYGVAALISSITIARKVVNHEQRITELERECKEWKDAYHSLKMDYEQLKLKIA